MLQKHAAHSPRTAPQPPLAAPVAGDTQETRYAVYFAPHLSCAWWTFGSAWLGRDALTGDTVAHPRIAYWDAAQLPRITAEPRRYGFHATLKAPFRLAYGHTARDVYLQAVNLAASLNAVPVPRLVLTELDGFIALSFLPSVSGAAAIHAIAAQCVSCFDNLRAPATAAELERRHASTLSPRQARLLAQWGYPHVFDEYRFHLTLTGRLPEQQRAQIIEALAPMVEALNATPLMFDSLTIYRQAERDAPFVATRRFHFDGAIDLYRDE